MNELITVNYDSDRPTTGARSLWEFLDKPHGEFMKWFSRYVEYGFTENVDYRPYRQISRHANGRDYEVTDYEITIDMAKELCMLQRTEKGKIARQYFIELEKKWNSPEAVFARALRMADERIKSLETTVEQQKPLVLFAETCIASDDSLLVREVAKLASKKDVTIGEKRLWRKLREWGVVNKKNEPYQYAFDAEWFEVKQGAYSTPYGTETYRTYKVTPKGQVYIIEKLKKEQVSA